jgi:aldose 1-epimerase
VLNTATYTVTNNAEWISRLVSIPLTTATPIMLANHPYWNLGAYISPDAQTILDNTFHMPYAKRYIATDGILIPTGELRLTAGTPLDFTRAKPIGQDILSAQDLCGTGCVGYDNALILDRPVSAIQDPELEVLRMWAPSTGIEMRLRTNMQGLQVYSCDGQNGTIPVKRGQQHGFGKGGNGTTTFVEKYGCVVLETQDVSFPPFSSHPTCVTLRHRWRRQL